MSIKTIFKSTVLVTALMCLTFVTASAQNEVVKTFLFSTATTAQDYLSLSMTDPDDNTVKIIISAAGSNGQQQGIMGAGSRPTRLLNKTNYEIGSTGSDVEFIISPYVNGKVTKIEFTNARRSSTRTETCDKPFSMSINGMRYDGIEDALSGDGSDDEKANFTFLSTSNQGVAGSLSLILGPGSRFYLQSDSKMIITYIPNVAQTHQHNFSFNAEGNTLTATCAHDDGLACSLAESNYQATLTLAAKDGDYDPYSVHIATHNLSGFNSKTGLSATTNNIVYTNKSDNTTSTSPVTAEGEYTATLVVTIGNIDYTLTTDFCISDSRVAYTNKYPNLLDAPSYGYSNKDYNASITFHPYGGISLLTLTITGENTNMSIGNGITDNGNNIYSFKTPREAVTIDATFEATIAINCKNGGSVSASVGENTNVTKAQSGETVTLTATPDEGYSVTNIHVYNGNNNYTVTNNGDGTYSFTMPASAVTVEVEFSSTIVALTISHFGDRTTAIIDGSSSEPISIASDIEVDEVTYSRTFESGAYTVMLPFGFDASIVDGNFYTLADIKGDKSSPVWEAIMSNPVQTIEANKPYIFVPNAPITEIKITGKTTLHKTVGAPLTNVCENKNWKLHGVYDKKVWTNEDVNLYGFAAAPIGEIAAGEFVHFVTGATLKATRCYLEYSKDGFSKSAVVLPEKIIVVFPETSSVIEPNDPENNGDVITPVSEIAPNSGTKVWSYDGTIFIEAQPNTDYAVIDITGRTLKTGVTTSTRETVTLSRRAAGIVIVKINGKTFKINY